MTLTIISIFNFCNQLLDVDHSTISTLVLHQHANICIVIESVEKKGQLIFLLQSVELFDFLVVATLDQ